MRWYRSLPDLGKTEHGVGIPLCPPYPAGYRLKLPIGPEIIAFLCRDRVSEFTEAPIGALDDRVDAIYDRAHRIGFFHEHGTDIDHYLLIAGAEAPPVTVKEKDLSGLAMSGVVHLGDTLDKVRAAFSLPSAFQLTLPAPACGFPQAAAYRAAIFYPPSKLPPSSHQNCTAGQASGVLAFRANRVAVMEWDYFACI